MRKLVLFFIVIVSVLSASAQRASEMDVTWHNADDFARSGVFAEVAAGYHVGGSESGVGAAVSLGYRYNIIECLSWDVAKIGYNTLLKEISMFSDLRFLTGLRYHFGADRLWYTNFAIGYHYISESYDDSVGSGLAYEAGFGRHLTDHIALGVTWEGSHGIYSHCNSCSSESSDWGILGVKLGFQF